MAYSQLVEKHLVTKYITDQYLYDTYFTAQDLEDIANVPYALNVSAYDMKPKPYVNRYVKKAKMRESATAYEKHRARLLQKA